MKLCCDWCHREITAAVPQTWGRYHFCSVAHKHYFCAGLNGTRKDADELPRALSDVQ